MIRLGWKNLIHDRMRLSVTVVGVTFSVVLMLLQSGIYFGFLDSVSGLMDRSPADVWIASSKTLNADTARAVPEETVLRVKAVPGVAWAERVSLSWAGIHLADGTHTWVQVYGINPDTGVGGPPEMIAGSLTDLRRAGTYIIDEASLPLMPGVRVGDKIEAFGQKIEVVGMCRGVKSYSTYAVLFTSYRTAQDQLLGMEDRVSFVTAKFAEGADRGAVLERLRRLGHFDVYTSEEFHDKVRKYWGSSTGIGLGIGLTMILGFIVGVVIVGQTMYSATVERLREYATLKAMGATNLEICTVIWTQAIVVGVVGYVVGGLVSLGLTFTSAASVMAITLSPQVFVVIFVATAVMCLGASFLSIVRALRVDPATVFRT